jgi:phenylpropionate dioxygenase-like ring-hydroxylating dioxygenase large terminal subunit
MNIQSKKASAVNMLTRVNDLVQPKLKDSERSGLPGWTYFNEEAMELEKEHLFRRCWQLLGHVNDIPEPGDYLTFDIAGERAIAVRGKDGRVRCFHNVCRHRGSRVVADKRGSCKSAIVCPFHGWAYNLDGTLRGAPAPRSLPDLDPETHGLPKLEHEIFHGYVFVRFKSGPQPSVADMLKSYEPLFVLHRAAETVPISRCWEAEMPANWKAVRDVDNEGYHVPIAHPALYDLYGRQYVDELPGGGVSRSVGRFDSVRSKRWSVRHYKTLRPASGKTLGDEAQNWTYIGMFPNLVFVFYPEQIGYYQEWPISVQRTFQRGSFYGLRDDRRDMKLARYLAFRIERETTREDHQLIVWSCEAMKSSAFPGIILSDHEAGVRAYHDQLRSVLPVYGLEQEPPPGMVAKVNEQLSQGAC